MDTTGPDELERCVTSAAGALRAAGGLDWSLPAAGLDWSCRDTAVHLAGDLTGFAAQLAGRARDRYLPLTVGAAPGTPPDGLVDLVEAGGRLLVAAVRAARPQDRAWHPAGLADPGAFAAMGAAELLLHTHDVLTGLGRVGHPRDRDAAAVLDRLFPHAPRSAAAGPWASLLAATGRADVPGVPRQRVWRWYNDAVRGEGVALCAIGPRSAEDLLAGGTGGFAWTPDGPGEQVRTTAARVLRTPYRSAGGAAGRPAGRPAYAVVRLSDHLAVGSIGPRSAPDADADTDTDTDTDADGYASGDITLAPSARGEGLADRALAALRRSPPAG
ncbi:maleylpyruvate isomerase N-terminal domain-containing protein [Streptomyces sp. NPDC087917]|uniref:maleylpyruvate isomerase N-terminal domain-containing protein n=1 Tax=Streptomyces sp. NPDC087917 TaxID=3155060 RepID=UPI00341C4AB3